MRLLVTSDRGIKWPPNGGRVYQMGEELYLPDDSKGKLFGNVMIHKKYAKRAEPVIVGAAPHAPRPPLESTPGAIEPISTSTAPSQFQTKEDAPPPTERATPEDEAAQETEEEGSDDSPTEGDAPRRRGRPPIHGRYSRRDLRPEE